MPDRSLNTRELNTREGNATWGAEVPATLAITGALSSKLQICRSVSESSFDLRHMW